MMMYCYCSIHRCTYSAPHALTAQPMLCNHFSEKREQQVTSCVWVDAALLVQGFYLWNEPPQHAYTLSHTRILTYASTLNTNNISQTAAEACCRTSPALSTSSQPNQQQRGRRLACRKQALRARSAGSASLMPE